jgi:hypothetical protein
MTRSAVWTFALGFSAAVFMLAHISAVHVDVERSLTWAAGWTLLAASGALLPWPRIGACVELFALKALCVRPAVLLGYVTYNLSRDLPLQDARIAYLDSLLGFDWLKVLQWSDAHPWLSAVLAQAYDAFIPLQLFALLLLAALGHARDARALLVALWSGLILIHAVAALCPAVGAFGLYGLNPADHGPLVSAGYTVPEVLAARSGVPLMFDAGHRLGVITMPSYHASVAVILAWSVRSLPVVRWIMLGACLLMLMATPLHGSHHLSDVIAGAALALPCICLAAHRAGSRSRADTNASPVLARIEAQH